MDTTLLTLLAFVAGAAFGGVSIWAGLKFGFCKGLSCGHIEGAKLASDLSGPFGSGMSELLLLVLAAGAFGNSSLFSSAAQGSAQGSAQGAAAGRSRMNAGCKDAGCMDADRDSC